jgi:hypothetical protein
MTDYYLSAASDGAGTPDDPLDPYPTFVSVEAAGLGDGDRLLIEGDFEIGAGDNGGFIDITADYQILGFSGQPTITGNNGVRVLRNSGSLAGTDEPVFQDLTIDAEGKTYALELSLDTTGPDICQVRRVHATGAASAHVFIGREHGLIELRDLEISGSTRLGVATASTTAGTTAETNISLRGLRCTNVVLDSTAARIVQIQRAPLATSKVVAALEQVIGDVDAGGFAVDFINMEAIDEPVVKDCNLTLRSSAAGECIGIKVNGTSSYNTEGAVVVGNVLTCLFNAGHGMQLSDDTDNYGRTGSFVGNHVTGQYDASATPHGITLAGQSTGEMLGNVVRDTFAAFLVSETTTARVVGNLAFNCHGPSFYVKGANGTAGAGLALEDNLVANNVAVRKATTLARNQSCLSITNQIGNTDNAVFEANTVIAEDPEADAARGGSYLAEFTSAGQTGEFRRNVYIIPDTVNLATATIFGNNGAAATFATWIGRSDVIDDRVIQLPIAEIQQLISYYEALSQPGAMAGAGGQAALIRPIISLM